MWLKVIRLMLIRAASAWSLVLLTLNFNRIAIVELQAVAVVVTTLIALSPFFSLCQPFFGQLSDMRPVFGLRRTPYILIGTAITSVAFMALPSLAVGLGTRTLGWTALAFLVFAVIAVSEALSNAAGAALLVDLLPETARDRFVPLISTANGLFGIVVALASGAIMPVYTPEGMQLLYNLSPLVMGGLTLLGLLGLEPRVESNPGTVAPALPPGGLAGMLSNPEVNRFFVCLFLIFLGVYMQDTILEPMGGEVFGLTPGQTAAFQAPLGGGLLLSLVGFSALWAFRPLAAKPVVALGVALAATALLLLGGLAFSRQGGLLMPVLLLLGFSIGIFQVGLSVIQVQMVVAGRIGAFLGIWAMARGLGNGSAAVLAGGLHTALIGTGTLPVHTAYATIFVVEVLIVLGALLLFRAVDTRRFGVREADTVQLSSALGD
jgi:BCD family chlorophyll transporter-like MFS transporter